MTTSEHELLSEAAEELRKANEDIESAIPLRFIGGPDALSALAAAMANAQGEYETIPKSMDGQIGHQRFKYANLAKIMDAVRPALSKNGIAMLQPLSSSPKGPEWERVTTTIMGHGARIEASYDFRRADARGEGAQKAAIQEWGRILTYIRRYNVQAFLVLEGDADADDPHPSDNAPPKPRQQKRPPTNNPRYEPSEGPGLAKVTPPSDDQLEAIRNLLNELGVGRTRHNNKITELGYDPAKVKADSKVTGALISRLNEELDAARAARVEGDEV